MARETDEGGPHPQKSRPEADNLIATEKKLPTAKLRPRGLAKFSFAIFKHYYYFKRIFQ
jgi:hypothetical protein